MQATDKLPIELLLVDDSPSDVILAREALTEARISNNLAVVENGEEALKYLRNQEPYEDRVRPDLVLLDLNMPRMNGYEVLEIVKADPQLSSVPIIVLTSSQEEDDVVRSYSLHANCFISKPVRYESFIDVIRSIEDFWFSIATLPKWRLRK